MKCKLKEKELDFIVFDPLKIKELYDFVDFDKTESHSLQIMLPTKHGMRNVYKGDYIINKTGFYEILTEEEFNIKYNICG
jgi:hypothetical protein